MLKFKSIILEYRLDYIWKKIFIVEPIIVGKFDEKNFSAWQTLKNVVNIYEIFINSSHNIMILRSAVHHFNQ